MQGLKDEPSGISTPHFELPRDLAVHSYSLRVSLRGNRWLVVVPVLIALAVTITQVLWKDSLSDTLQVSTAEIMGSLLAGFLGANMLDAELRQGAGELIFAKPYSPWRLIMGRVIVSLLTVVALVSINAVALQVFRHLHYTLFALLAGLAPGLFLCAVGCALYVASSNAVLGYTGPALCWVWSTIGAPVGVRFDRLYNPLFQISAWSDYLNDPSAQSLETLLACYGMLTLTALLLLGWCACRVRLAAQA